MTTHTDTGQLLTSVRDLLHEIETVLTHASPATHDEITTILATHTGNRRRSVPLFLLSSSLRASVFVRGCAAARIQVLAAISLCTRVRRRCWP